MIRHAAEQARGAAEESVLRAAVEYHTQVSGPYLLGPYLLWHTTYSEDAHSG